MESLAISEIQWRQSIEILLKLYFPLRLQIVLPEGRNVPQPLDNRGKMFDDIIHLFFRVVDGEAETDRPVSSGERNTHGPEDMRSLQ